MSPPPNSPDKSSPFSLSPTDPVYAITLSPCIVCCDWIIIVCVIRAKCVFFVSSSACTPRRFVCQPCVIILSMLSGWSPALQRTPLAPPPASLISPTKSHWDSSRQPVVDRIELKKCRVDDTRAHRQLINIGGWKDAAPRLFDIALLLVLIRTGFRRNGVAGRAL